MDRGDVLKSFGLPDLEILDIEATKESGTKGREETWRVAISFKGRGASIIDRGQRNALPRNSAVATPTSRTKLLYVSRKRSATPKTEAETAADAY